MSCEVKYLFAALLNNAKLDQQSERLTVKVVKTLEIMYLYWSTTMTCHYRKPSNISPPEYKAPPPMYKPTTCTNAHLIPNISPPP
jgi:hypothetical protein